MRDFAHTVLGMLPNLQRIHRKQIVSVISDSLLGKNNVTCKAFVKALKANKQNIFHKDDVPGKQMSQIHALVLQLYANGIIGLGVSDETEIGTENLSGNHIVVVLKNTKRMV